MNNRNSKDCKPTLTYQDRRMQHRSMKRSDNFCSALQQKVVSKDIKPSYGNLMTVELKHYDGDMFSDQKIKNYNSASTECKEFKSRMSIRLKEGEDKKSEIEHFNDEIIPKEVVKQQKTNFFQKSRYGRVARLYSAKCNSNPPPVVDQNIIVSRPTTTFGHRKSRKHVNKSMEIESRNVLTPTIFALKLKATMADKKVDIMRRSFLMDSKTKMNTKRQTNSFAKQINADSGIKKASNTMGLDYPDKRAFKIDGWEFDNPSYNEFQDFDQKGQQQPPTIDRDIRAGIYAPRVHLKSRYN